MRHFVFWCVAVAILDIVCGGSAAFLEWSRIEIRPVDPVKPVAPVHKYKYLQKEFYDIFDTRSTSVFYPTVEVFRFLRSSHSTYFLTLRRHTQLVEKEVQLQCSSSKFTLQDSGVCISKVTTEAEAACPEGFVASKKEKNICVQTHDALCPGTKKGDKCIVTDCPSGYVKHDTLCYSICPSGYQDYYSNFCITKRATCPRDFEERYGRCYLSFCPDGMRKTKTHCESECPPEMTRFGSKCISSKLGQCPKNYVLRGKTCFVQTCPKNEIRLRESACVSRDFMRCPAGYDNYETVCRKCIQKNESFCQEWSTKCPQGWFKISKSECVQVCPTKTAAFNDECISLREKGCPAGFLRFPGKGCVRTQECPEGYHRVMDDCVMLETGCSAFSLDGKCLDACPDGYAAYENRCIHVSTAKCPENFGELQKNFCVEKCPKDHVMVGKKCIPKIPCPQSEYYLFGKCYKECPLGFLNDTSEGICVPVSGKCSKDQVNNHGVCISTKECLNKNRMVDEVFSVCHNTTLCSVNDIYFGAYCLSRCPLGFTSLLRTCQKKPEKAKCESGLVFREECVQRCPDGYQPRFGTCVTIPDEKVQRPKCGENMVATPCESNQTVCEVKCVCQLGYVTVQGLNETKCVPQIEACHRRHRVDVVYVIDASNFLLPLEFERLRLFTLETVAHLFSTKNRINVGIVVIGPQEPHIIYLHRLREECDLIKSLISVLYSNTNTTSIVTGIRVARELVLSQCNGARVGSVRHIFVFSSARQFTPTAAPALNDEIEIVRLMGNRLSFFTLGNVNNLHSDVYSFNIENFNHADQYAMRLATIVCKEFSCPKGYKQKWGACVDVDECAALTCHNSSRCINTPGSFLCVCPVNLTYVDHSQGCRPNKPKVIDCGTPGKPTVTNVCDVVKCKGEANCSSYSGQAFCVCPTGFTYDDKLGCVDVDECKLKVCLDGANCTNTNGSFRCGCKPGYEYNKHFGCVDVDECATQRNICVGNATCQNLEGTFTCVCPKGYKYQPTRGCEDIDECAIGSPCTGSNVVCVNTRGSFACVCAEGFQYSGSGCVDKDECQLLGEKACGNGSVCINTSPGYKCTCKSGFVYNKQKALCEVDETSGVQQKRADLIFLVDSGKAMDEELFVSSKKLMGNIMEDYKARTTVVIKRSSLVQLGHPITSTETVFVSAEDDKALEGIRNIKILGGSMSVLDGLKKAREIYQTKGQPKATRLIFLITATSLTEKTDETAAIKELVAQIKSDKDTNLLVILVGKRVTQKEWELVMTKEEVESMIYLVDQKQITQLHKLVFQKSDHMFSCPEGFVVVNEVCQMKTSQVKTCRMDKNEYLLNSTWSKECVQYQCTATGVNLLSVQCMGYDGDCYDESQEFPCSKDGVYHPYCRCTLPKETTLKRTGGVAVKYHSINWSISDVKNIAILDNCTCQFPFKYRSTWYYSCTRTESSNLWCGMDTNYQNQRYCTCAEPSRDCLLEDETRKKDGSRWMKDCNELRCDKGVVSVITKCRDKDNNCVPPDVTFSCVIANQTYNNCVCIADAFKFGVLKTVDSSHVSVVGQSEGKLSTKCVNVANNINYAINEEWANGCFKLKCVEGGKVEIVKKGCAGAKSECFDVGAKGFSCLIEKQPYTNCTCLAWGDGVKVSAFSEGQTITETKSSSKESFQATGKNLKDLVKALN